MTKINQANTCHPNGAAAYKSANLSYYPIRSSTEIDRHLPPLHHHQPLGFVLRSEEAKMLGIARQRIVCGGVSASTLQRIRTQSLLYASRNYSSTAKEASHDVGWSRIFSLITLSEEVTSPSEENPEEEINLSANPSS
ncbi:hypothetical protein HYC85_004502 [Camellia sinensis]|uniref:Uncharacterized protein n=1 Tax=Camellia sinensis TaxID=4442 RepID=A0A7J7HXY6_CAMSI|nr:hypothetical protein HYC85_004502 [Camellia sinensis]